MDKDNPFTSETLGLLNDALDAARRVEKASEDMARGSESWRETIADREGFQRFETARKQRANTGRRHCQLIDGSMRYADKPFTRERPRAISPELLQFYTELEMEALKL